MATGGEIILARDRAAKWGLLAAWGLLLIVSGVVYVRAGIPIRELPQATRLWFLRFGPMAPAIFILVFTLRPLILFPTWVLCLVAGLVWGPMLGIVYTLIGDNLSAGFAFWLARKLGSHWYHPDSTPLMKKVDRLLAEYGFMTVLILRLLNIPIDLVSYGCGLTRMKYKPFAGGTFLGLIPGTVTVVVFGDAWMHPSSLILSGVLLLAAVGLALFMRSTPLGSSILEAVKKDKAEHKSPRHAGPFGASARRHSKSH